MKPFFLLIILYCFLSVISCTKRNENLSPIIDELLKSKGIYLGMSSSELLTIKPHLQDDDFFGSSYSEEINNNHSKLYVTYIYDELPFRKLIEIKIISEFEKSLLSENRNRIENLITEKLDTDPMVIAKTFGKKYNKYKYWHDGNTHYILSMPAHSTVQADSINSSMYTFKLSIKKDFQLRSYDIVE